MPCVRLLLCLCHTVLVTALLPPTPSNVESACNDSWCEGPFKSKLHCGWRGDARICGVFAKVSQDFWPGSWPKVLGTPGKNTRKIGHLSKMPCVRLLLCLCHTVLVTALPPPTPSNVESACNDSWCEGPFKSKLHCGWRGIREFAVFLRKCPKTFGQDCRYSHIKELLRKT